MNINELLEKLNQNSLVQKVIYFDEIDSTNTYLLNQKEDFNGLLVIAGFQTAGRGRLQRKWLADKYQNLTFSLSVKPDFETDKLPYINFAIALATAESVEKIINKEVEIKWPNDLLIDGKKFCGMLIESQFSGSSIEKLVIGIGININQTEFDDEFRSRTTSLFLAINQEVSMEKLLADIVNRFSDFYFNIESDFQNIFKRWKTKCKSIGKQISLTNGNEILTGIFEDVAPDGSLILKKDNETISLNAGDVTVIKNKN